MITPDTQSIYQKVSDRLTDGPFAGRTITDVYMSKEYHYLLNLINSGRWNASSSQKDQIVADADRQSKYEQVLLTIVDDELDYTDNRD